MRRRRGGDCAAVAMLSSSSLAGCFCGMFCCYICVLAATVLCFVLCIGHKMRSSDTLKPPKHRGDFLDVAAVNDSLSRPRFVAMSACLYSLTCSVVAWTMDM